MPPVTEQQNTVPPPVQSTPAPKTSGKLIKTIRIFLLVLIVIGLALIATEKLWVPNLVDEILGKQTSTTTYTTPGTEQTVPVKIPVFTWASVPASEVSQFSNEFSWADAATLEVATFVQGTTTIETPYYKDKNQVHFIAFTDWKIIGADPATFTVLGFVPSDGPPDDPNAYAKDTNHAYHNGLILEGADPSTIATVYDDTQGVSFDTGVLVLKDKNALYGIATTSSALFDIPTFVSAGGSYFKDKNQVYCVAVGNETTNVLENADPTTFTDIPDSDYAIDKNNVYVLTLNASGITVGCAAIGGSDPSMFAIVVGTHGQVAKDKNQVYLSGKEFPLDPNSLMVLNANYVKDTKSVYYDDPSSLSSTYYQAIGWRPIVGADAKTFSVLPPVNKWGLPSFAKDAYHVYGNGNLIQGADPNTFTTLGATVVGAYAKDVNYLYYVSLRGTQIIQGADLTTFVATTTYRLRTNDNSFATTSNYSLSENGTIVSDAQDKNNSYLEGQIIQ